MERTAGQVPCMQDQRETLRRVHKIGLGLLVAIIVLFGVWVELRGAFLQRRMTDVGPYLRAAWAVRTDHDIYKITDNRDLHYVYPPLFAILMTPFADPPDGVDRTGYLPYKVSVGIWYVLTALAGMAGIHKLARVIEARGSPGAVTGVSRFSRQWWALRVLPFLILLPAIGRSQMRGQVGLIIAFLLCYAAASILQGRRFRAGLWLSFAICVKLLPLLLLAFPLWRRDWRMIMGSVLGLVAGLAIVPVMVMGPMKTVDAYEALYQGTIVAGIRGDTGGALGKELTGITSTDSNSPMAVIHNIMYPGIKHRPKVASPAVRAAHWIIAFIIIAVTLLASGWKGKWYAGKIDATLKEAGFMCSFIPLMFIASPVFHPHYVSMAIPLVMLLLVLVWERYSYCRMPAAWKAVFCFVAASHILTAIDRATFFLYLRDFGLVLFSTISLWIAGLVALRRAPEKSPVEADTARRTGPVKISKMAVVLPAFNESETIGRTVESIIEFSAGNPGYFFLFVDDGSSDGTADVIMKTLKGREAGNVSFVSYPENRGKGYAIRKSCSTIAADAYCFMDADMAYSPDYLKLIEERLKYADVVIGARRISARLTGESGTRALLGALFNRFVRYILDLPFRDTQAGLKGLRKEALVQIFRTSAVNGFSFDAELLFQARKYGFRVEEIRVEERTEHVYKSGWKLFVISLSMVRDLVFIRWRNLIGRYD